MSLYNRPDPDFCGRVPLNQTNLIQPHGFLLVLETHTHKILQVSENVETILQIPIRSVIGQSLHHWLPEAEMQQIKKISLSTGSVKVPLLLSFGGHPLPAELTTHGTYFVLEVSNESRKDGYGPFLETYYELNRISLDFAAATSTADLCRLAAREIRRVSGFDKVMIYRFDPEWNGDVVAEEMEEGMDAYLGLKFPASDIPPQAREIYRKSPYRLIPDVAYQPIRLYPVINPLTNSFTDLSVSNLRSVAEVHLEYLRNMKVGASMSVRILVNNNLWGLVSCHHRTARFPDIRTCALIELVSVALSARITNLLEQDKMVIKTEKMKQHARISESLYASGFPALDTTVTSLLDADGVALVMNRDIRLIGDTPTQNQVAELLHWLQSFHPGKRFTHHSLPSVYEHAADYAQKASGILAIPVAAGSLRYLIAFRGERVRSVTWGGNPEATILFEADGKKYHPRASFQSWQQTVVHSSHPWTAEQLDVADELNRSIKDYVLTTMHN